MAMPNQNAPDPADRKRLFAPSPKAEEDFSVLRILDNSVLGICAFVIDYFAVLLRLLFTPRRAADYLSCEPGRACAARPFVFLFFSVIPGATLINWNHAQSLLLGDLLGEYVRNFSWARILLIALPITIASVLLIAFASRILARDVSRQRAIVSMWSYVLGAQYLLAAGMLVLFAVQVERSAMDLNNEETGFLFDIMVSLGAWGLLLIPVLLLLAWLYALALPVLVIGNSELVMGEGRRPWRGDSEGDQSCSSALWARSLSAVCCTCSCWSSGKASPIRSHLPAGFNDPVAALSH